jgi:SAM-dependent methyltransferase
VDLALLKTVPDLAWTSLAFSGIELPPMPPEQIQRNWCGNAGVGLAVQSAEFYTLIKDTYARYADGPFSEARVLDFGCGWGRLARLLLKDLPPELIHGCDPDPNILEWCQRIPGTFRPCEPRPRTLPFEKPFDLVYAFSVFTHLGPNTHMDALDAIHRSLKPGGLFIVTVRPRAFLETREFSQLGDEPLAMLQSAYDRAEYLHRPYNLPPVDGEVTYGETVLPTGYISRHWSDRFELLSSLPYESDVYQVPLAMRRLP